MKSALIDKVKKDKDGGIPIKGETAKTFLLLSLAQIIYEKSFVIAPIEEPTPQDLAQLQEVGLSILKDVLPHAINQAVGRIIQEKKEGSTKPESYLCMDGLTPGQLFRVSSRQITSGTPPFEMDVQYMQLADIRDYASDFLAKRGIDPEVDKMSSIQHDDGFQVNQYRFVISPIKLYQNN